MSSKFSYTRGNSFVVKKKLTNTANSQRMVCWHVKVKENPRYACSADIKSVAHQSAILQYDLIK